MLNSMLSNKTIADVMVKVPEVKTVLMDEYFHDAIEVLNKNKWGAVFIVDKSNKLLGILTDGDARRVYAKNQEPMAQLNSDPITKYMNANPSKVTTETKVVDLIKVMNQKGFLCAPVVNGKDEFVGVVHLQHLVTEMLKSL
jgi:arabinose-5-phosphate isomerase